MFTTPAIPTSAKVLVKFFAYKGAQAGDQCTGSLAASQDFGSLCINNTYSNKTYCITTAGLAAFVNQNVGPTSYTEIQCVQLTDMRNNTTESYNATCSGSAGDPSCNYSGTQSATLDLTSQDPGC